MPRKKNSAPAGAARVGPWTNQDTYEFVSAVQFHGFLKGDNKPWKTYCEIINRTAESLRGLWRRMDVAEKYKILAHAIRTRSPNQTTPPIWNGNAG